MVSNRVLAAFDKGQIPRIACVNLATQPLGVNFQRLVSALQTFVDRHLVPVWGTPCILEVAKKKIPHGDWGMLFVDDDDVAGSLGYHDLTEEGLPLSKISVNEILGAGESVSETAGHELVEMLVDPGLQLGAQHPGGDWYAYEPCDPVQGTSFHVNRVLMPNFVYPSWFEGFRSPQSTKFDHLDACTRPFQILRTGWMPIFRRGKWISQFGSTRAKRQYGKRNHGRTTWRGDPAEAVRSS